MTEINPKEFARRMEQYRDGCSKAGVKLTYQRLIIMEELARANGHPDAEMIHIAVRQRIPMISLDTVYRTLWLLRDLKLIESMGTIQDRVRFDANPDPHHHFICTRCGETRDFFDEKLNRLNVPATVVEMGTVETIRVEIRGLCSECIQAENKL
jgi:Fur family transcriptional regulator, peroxide stress response regulator